MKKLVLNMGTVAKIRVLGFAVLSIILGSSELAWGQDYSSVVDGDWEEATTWGGSTPTENKSIAINNKVTLNSNYTALGVTINSGGQLTIKEGYTLTAESGANFAILDNVTIDGDGTIIIKHKIKGNSKTLTTNANVFAEKGINGTNTNFSWAFDNLSKLIVNKNTFTNNRDNITIGALTINEEAKYVANYNGTISNALTLNGGTLEIASGKILTPKTISITKSSTIKADGKPFPDGKTISIPAGETLTIDGNVDLSGTTVTCAGNIEVKDGAVLTLGSLAEIGGNLEVGSGASVTVAADLRVNGNAVIKGTVGGSGHTITVAGSTVDLTDAELGTNNVVIAENATIEGLSEENSSKITFSGEPKSIIYDETSTRIIEGTYSSLTVEGGTKTLTGNVSVTGSATLAGTVNLDGNTLTIGGSAIDLTGLVSFGNSGTVALTNSSVALTGVADCHEGVTISLPDNVNATYDATSTQILSANYTDLTINNSVGLCGAVTVSGTFTTNVEGDNITISGGKTLTLKGAVLGGKVITASGTGTSIVLDENGEVTAGFAIGTGATFTNSRGGTISSLEVNGGTANINATTIVNGDASLGGTIAFNGEGTTLTIGGDGITIALEGLSTTAPSQIVINSGSIITGITGCPGISFADEKPSMTYGAGSKVLSGTYTNLTLEGNAELCGNVTVEGIFTVENNAEISGSGTLSLEGDVVNANTITVAGAAIELNGSSTTVEPSFVVNTGSFTNNRACTISSITVNGGEATIGAATTLTDFSVNGGAAYINENLIVNNAALLGTIEIAAGKELSLNDNGIVTYGSNDITGSGHVVANGGNITIAGLTDCNLATGIDLSTLSTKNVTYGEGSTCVLDTEYGGLTVGEENVTLCGDVIVGGTLTWNCRNITLNGKNLTVGSIDGSSYSSTHMIVAGGDATLTITNPGTAVVFPVGTGSDYTPVEFSVIDGTSHTIGVAVNNAVAEGGNDFDLQRTWTIGSTNVTSANLEFTFVDTDSKSNLSKEVMVDGDAVISVSSFGNNTMTATASPINGTWTAKNGGRILYAYKNGPWNGDIWTDKSSGEEPDAPVSAPGVDDNVIILPNKSVTATDNVAAKIVEIRGELDLDSYTADFAYLHGTGKLIQTNTYNIGVNCEDHFREATGGTVELNGDFSGLATFNFRKLVLDADATDVEVTLGNALVLSESLTMNGSHEITINGDINAAGDILVEAVSTVTGDVTAGGDITLDKDANITGSVSANSITVDESSIINGNITVTTITVAAGETLTISGDHAITADLIDASAEGAKVIIEGGVTINEAILKGSIEVSTGNALTVNGTKAESDVTFGGDGNVTLASGGTLNGNISAARLAVGANATVNAGVTVTNLSLAGDGATINGTVAVSGELALGGHTLTINNPGKVTVSALTFNGATVDGTGELNINGTLSEASITLNVKKVVFDGTADFDAATTITVGSGATLTNNRDGKTLTGLTINDGGNVLLKKKTTLSALMMYGNSAKLIAEKEATIQSGSKLSGTITSYDTKLRGEISFGEILALNGKYTAAINVTIDNLNPSACLSGYEFYPGEKTITYNANCSYILSAEYKNLILGLNDIPSEITLCDSVMVTEALKLTKPSGDGKCTIIGNGNKFIVNGNVESGKHEMVFNNVSAIFGNTAAVTTIEMKSVDLSEGSTFNIVKNAKTVTISNSYSNLSFKGDGEIIINKGAELTTDKNISFEKNQTISGKGEFTISTTSLTAQKLTIGATVNIGSTATVDDVKEYDIQYGGTLNYDNNKAIKKLTTNMGGTFVMGANVTVNDMAMTGGVTNLNGHELTIKDGTVLALSANDTIIGGDGSKLLGKIDLDEGAKLTVDGAISLNHKLQVEHNATIIGFNNGALNWTADKTVEVATGKALSIGGNLTFGGDLTLDGAIKIDDGNDLTSEALNLSGGSITFTSATDFSGASIVTGKEGKLAFTSSATTINNLAHNPNIAYKNIDYGTCNITYANNCTYVLPGKYNDLTVSMIEGNDISLYDSVEVSGALGWSAGRINIGGNKLTISQNALAGSFGPTYMIVVADGGKLAYKAKASVTTLKMPVGTHTYGDMGESNYQYTPVQFGSLSGIVAGDTITVQVKNAPKSGKGTDLRRYWVIGAKPEPIEAAPEFTYVTADDPYDHVGYMKMYRYKTEDEIFNEARIVNVDIDTDNKKISVLAADSICGIWTAVEYPIVQTLYSYKSGDWNKPEVWTTVSTGSKWENEGGATPDERYDVVILSNNEITGATTGSEKDLKVWARSVFIKGADAKLIIKKENNVKINELSGVGVLRIEDSGEFPDITHSDLFMAAGGGTTEFCGNPDGPGFDLDQASFNNLSIHYSKDFQLRLVKDKLQINGSLNIEHGELAYTKVNQAIHVDGDIYIATAGRITNNAGDGGDGKADTLQVGGNFANHGEVRLTLRDYNTYTIGIAKSQEGDKGRGILRFVGEKDVKFDCFNITNISQLIIDKGSDETHKVTLETHDAEENFGLLGQSINPQKPIGFAASTPYPPNPELLTKPLWIKCGTLELKGYTHLRSLSEDGGNGDDWKRDCFYIPAKGCLYLNGPNVKVEPTLAEGTNIGWGALIPAGKLIIEDGTYDGKGTTGISYVGSSYIEVRGGTLKVAQFGKSNFSDGLTTFILSGGTVEVHGDGQVKNDQATFNMPNADYTFQMSGGTLIVGTAVVNAGALVVKANPANGEITDGEIIVNTGAAWKGTTEIDGKNYTIESTMPFHDLTLRNTRERNLPESRYAEHNIKTSGNIIIKRNLKIEKDVVFNTQGKSVTIGGNFIVEEDAKVYTQNNEFILNGTGHVTVNGKVAKDGSSMTEPQKCDFYKLTIADGANITIDNNISVREKFTLGNNAELHDGADDNIYTMMKIAEINGTHVKRSTSPATVVLENGAGGYISSNGNGVLQNVKINSIREGAELLLRDPASDSKPTKLTINGDLTFATNTVFNIKSSNLEFGSDARVLTTVIEGFSPSCMIKVMGASSGGVTKVFSEGHNYFTYPFGFDTYYTPAYIKYSSAGKYGSITSRPVKGRVFRNDKSLNCYWINSEQGFENTGNLTFKGYWYNSGLVGGSLENYVAARKHGAEWMQEGTSSVSRTGTDDKPDERYMQITRNDITADGYYSCGEATSFESGTIYYTSSYVTKGADFYWNDPQCWSTEGVGGTPNTAPGAYPQLTTDAAQIGDDNNHDTIKLRGNLPRIASLSIAPGSTLDMDIYNGTFTIVEVDEAKGAGTLCIGKTNYFPGGDFGSFLGEHGGTVEYYSKGDGYTIKNLANYCNLVVSGGTADAPMKMPNQNVTVYKNFTVNGWVRSTEANGRTVTVGDSLNIKKGDLMLWDVDGQTQTYKVLGDVNVFKGAVLEAKGTATNAKTNKLTIYGDLTVDGTFNAYYEKESAPNVVEYVNKFDTEFIGADSSIISGTADIIKFNTLTCNKADLDTRLVLRNKNVKSSDAQKLLVLTKGTFEVDIKSGDVSLTKNSDLDIPIDARLSVISGNVKVADTTQRKSISLNGHILIEGGCLFVGRETVNQCNSILIASEGKPSITIKGTGRLVVNGQISRRKDGKVGSLIWEQSGGEVIINGKLRGTSDPLWISKFAAFEIRDNGEFNMSGGKITLMKGGGNECGDIYIKPTASLCTGGEIIIGGGEQILMTNVALHDLKVDNGAVLNAYDDINVNKLTIEETGIYNAIEHELAIRGAFINHNSVTDGGSATISKGFVPGSISQLTRFIGHGASIEGVSGIQTQFAQLEITDDVNLVAGKASIRVGGNLTQTAGTVSDNGNTIHLSGDLLYNGTFSGSGGINFCGTADKQWIKGTEGSEMGQIGKILVNNADEVWLDKDVHITNGIVLGSSLYINRSRVILDENATISASGGALSASRMIRLNGEHEDKGVMQYVKRKDDGTHFIYTIPIGIKDKDGVLRYTPVEYDFAYNRYNGASISVKAMNFRHNNISEDPTTWISYYWVVKTEGFNDDGVSEYRPSRSSDYSLKQTYTYDCDVEGDDTRPLLPEYMYYGGPLEYEWVNLTKDDTAIVSGNNIIFNQFGHIGGDYTAGRVADRTYTEKPVLYSRKTVGNWNNPDDDGRTWEYWDKDKVGDDKWTEFTGEPNGNPIHIRPGHRVNITGVEPVKAYCLYFDRTNKDGSPNDDLGILDIGETSGSDFGHVDGVGRLVMLPIPGDGGREYKMPAGDFEEFLKDPKSIIEFTGSIDAKLPNSVVGHSSQPMQNVVLSGTGVKTLTKETGEFINGSLTIENGTKLEFNNTPIHIKGDWIDENTGTTSGFNAGKVDAKSLVEFYGTSEQHIKLSNNATQFWKFQVNNPEGVIIEKATEGSDVPDNTPIGIGRELILTNGCVTTADNSHIVLASSSSVTGAGNERFVNGPLARTMAENDNFTFPVGNIVGEDKIYAPTVISNVSVGGDWKVTYHYATIDHDSLPPLTAVSHSEYWTFDIDAENATAKLGLRADEETMTNYSSDMLDRTMVIGLVNVDDADVSKRDKWEKINSTHTGSTLPATVTTSENVTIKGYQCYSLGYVGTTAKVTNDGIVNICDGDDDVAEIPITFTGMGGPYKVEYEVTSDGKIYTSTVELADGAALRFKGNELGRFFGRSGGFICDETAEGKPIKPYTIRLTKVWEGGVKGNINEDNNFSIRVKYNAVPVITGAGAVGMGETRTYSVATSYWDDNNLVNPYEWSATGDKDVTLGAGETKSEEKVTFPDNGDTDYGVNLKVTNNYKTGDFGTCSNYVVKPIAVKVPPQPDIHSVTTDGKLAACKDGVTEYLYRTEANGENEYEWSVEPDGLVEVISSVRNEFIIKWIASDKRTAKVKVTEKKPTNNPETPYVVGYNEKEIELENDFVIGTITPDIVCDGNYGNIVISGTTGSQSFMLCDEEGVALTEKFSGSDGTVKLGTPRALNFTDGPFKFKVLAMSGGCKHYSDLETETVRENPAIEKPFTIPVEDLYIGNLSKVTVKQTSEVHPDSYSFAYDGGVTYDGETTYTGTIGGSKGIGNDRTIKIGIPLESSINGKLTIRDATVDGVTCESTYKIDQPVSGDYLWRGTTNDWSADANWWSGSAPDGSKNAVIRTGKQISKTDDDSKDIVMPTVGVDAAVANIKMESGVVVTMNNTLTVNGNVTNAGKFVGEGGKVLFSGAEHTVSGSGSFTNISNEGMVTTESGIKILGDITNNGDFVGNGAVQLSGEVSAQSVAGDGSFTNITIANSKGVTVDGTPTINGTMTLSSGIVTANNQINFSTSGNMDEASSGWVKGKVQKTWIDNNNEFHFLVGGEKRLAQLDVLPDASGATFTVDYKCNESVKDPITENLGDGLERVSGKESWNITGVKAGGGVQPARIAFHWADAKASGIGLTEKAEENVNWKSTLVVAHRSDETSPWIMVSPIEDGVHDNKIIVHADSYSEYTFGATNKDITINPLPVTFIAFTGRQEGNSVVLEWATASENNNNYFEIERSIDGVNFVTIGYVDGAGNSSSLLNYEFTDNAPEQGQVYYRLSQVDFDGNREFADKVVAVLYAGSEIENLTIVPNPTDGLFCVSVTGSMAGGRIELLSQAGKMIRIVDVESYDATIDISDLPSGMYVLRFVTDTKVLQKKVVKY
jgi:cytoskeletal protein CcmA (bactofilin family)